MFRTLFFIIALLWPTNSFSDTIIVTKFDPGSQPFMILKRFVEQTKNYTDEKLNVVHVGGSRGESADAYAISISKTGRNVIIFGAFSSFTLNMLEMKQASSKLKDLKILGSISSLEMLIVSNQAKTIDDLHYLLRNQKDNYFATLQRSSLPLFLNRIFTRSIGIKESKVLIYKNYGEIQKALHIKEANYSIVPPKTIFETSILLSSSTNDNNALSGTKLGYLDFSYDGILLFSMPTVNMKNVDFYISLIKKICDKNRKEMLEITEKFGYNFVCLNEQQLHNKRLQDIRLIEKYK